MLLTTILGVSKFEMCPNYCEDGDREGGSTGDTHTHPGAVHRVEGAQERPLGAARGEGAVHRGGWNELTLPVTLSMNGG